MFAPRSAPAFATLASALFLILSVTTAQAGEQHAREHSHEHGHATLEIAADGNTLSIALEAPGSDIVGFEHVAETEAQKMAVQKALDTLSDAAAIFTLPEAAGCSVLESDAQLHRPDEHGEHGEFTAEYRYTCTNTNKVSPIKTNLFTLYPSIAEIEVAYATQTGQGRAELTATDPTITLPTAR